MVLDQTVFVPRAAGVPSITDLWEPLNAMEMWPETKAAARSLWLAGLIFRIIGNLHQASWFSSESQFLKCRRDRPLQSQGGQEPSACVPLISNRQKALGTMPGVCAWVHASLCLCMQPCACACKHACKHACVCV